MNVRGCVAVRSCCCSLLLCFFAVAACSGHVAPCMCPACIMQPPCGEPPYFAVSSAWHIATLRWMCGVCRQPCRECVHCICHCVLLQLCRAVQERTCAAATLACSVRVHQVIGILGGGMATKHLHRVFSDCRAVCSTGATAIEASTSVRAAGLFAVCPAEHVFFFLQQSYLMQQCGPCFFGYMPPEGVTFFSLHSSTRVPAVPDFAAFI